MKTVLQAGGMVVCTGPAPVACPRTDPHSGGNNGPAEDIPPPPWLVELFEISFDPWGVQGSLHRALVELGRSQRKLVETD